MYNYYCICKEAVRKMNHWEFQTLRSYSSLIPLNGPTPMWKLAFHCSVTPSNCDAKSWRRRNGFSCACCGTESLKWVMNDIQHVRGIFCVAPDSGILEDNCNWGLPLESRYWMISFAPIQTENGKHTWKRDENYDMLLLWKPRSFSAHREHLAFAAWGLMRHSSVACIKEATEATKRYEKNDWKYLQGCR